MNLRGLSAIALATCGFASVLAHTADADPAIGVAPSASASAAVPDASASAAPPAPPPETAPPPVASTPLATPPAPPPAASFPVSASLPQAEPDDVEGRGLARHPFIGQAYLTGGFVYGKSTNKNLPFDLGGMGFELGASYIVGQHFPGLRGGFWNGVLIQPGVSVYAATEIQRPVSVDNVDGALMMSGGLTVAYQFFGLFQQGADQHQGGIGLSVGYRIAYQYDMVWTPASGGSASGGDISHGLVASLLFPRYYLQNDHFGRLLLDVEVDRLPDSEVTFFKLGIGGGF